LVIDTIIDAYRRGTRYFHPRLGCFGFIDLCDRLTNNKNPRFQSKGLKGKEYYGILLTRRRTQVSATEIEQLVLHNPIIASLPRMADNLSDFIGKAAGVTGLHLPLLFAPCNEYWPPSHLCHADTC
jgi:hypothetical protein